MHFRIYALIEPDGTPRYVGQTDGPLASRLRGHLRARGRSARAEWLRSLIANGQQPGITQLEEIDGARRDAYRRETEWIRRLRADGHPLVNYP